MAHRIFLIPASFYGQAHFGVDGEGKDACSLGHHKNNDKQHQVSEQEFRLYIS